MTRYGCGSPSGSVAGSAGGVLLCMQLVYVAHLSASGSEAFILLCARAACHVFVCGMKQDMAPDSYDLVIFTITSRERGNNQRTDFATRQLT